MAGGIPLLGALMGQTDFRATAPRISTKPGEAAIAAQLRAAGQQAAASGYSLAAGSRGAGTPLALREGQRRAQEATLGAAGQATIAQQQLQQQAMIARANTDIQAQQINAQIAQSNSQGLGRLAGAAVMGGALALSDEDAKVMDRSYALSDERAKLLSNENAELKATLGRIVKDSTGPVYGTALDYADTYAPRPAMQRLPVPQQVQPQPRNELEAQVYGARVLEQRRQDAMRDAAERDAYLARLAEQQNAVEYAQAAQARTQAATDYQAQTGEIPQAVSDERAKQAGAMDRLQFPRGVEPVAFHYKPGMGDGPDQHYGVLAQDLEKSREGRTTVREEPSSGMKMVDTNRLTMLNTAKLAEFEQRMRKLGV